MADSAFWRAFLLGYGSAAVVALGGLTISGLTGMPMVRELAVTAAGIVGIAVGVRSGYKVGIQHTGRGPNP